MDLSVYRIKGWWYYLGYPLLGFSFAGSLNGLFIILSVVALSLAYAYSLNEKYDRNLETNEPLIPLLISLLLMIFLNIYQIMFHTLFLVLVTLYSHKSVKLKSIPLLVTVLNGIFFSLLFCVGYLGSKNPDVIMFQIFGLLFIFNIVAQLIHELSHLKDDRGKDISTTAVRFGETNTRHLLNLSILSGAIYSFWIYNLGTISQIDFFLIMAFWMFSTIIIARFSWDTARKAYRYIGTVVGALIFLLKITF